MPDSRTSKTVPATLHNGLGFENTQGQQEKESAMRTYFVYFSFNKKAAGGRKKITSERRETLHLLTAVLILLSLQKNDADSIPRNARTERWWTPPRQSSCPPTWPLLYVKKLILVQSIV